MFKADLSFTSTSFLTNGWWWYFSVRKNIFLSTNQCEFVTHMIHDDIKLKNETRNFRINPFLYEQIYFQNYFQRELLVACVFYLLLNVLFCYEYSPHPQWIQNRQISCSPRVPFRKYFIFLVILNMTQWDNQGGKKKSPEMLFLWFHKVTNFDQPKNAIFGHF